MKAIQFQLIGEIRTTNRPDVRAELQTLLPGGQIEDTARGFKFQAQLEGESAAALNRSLLSAVRQIAPRATLRSEWKSNIARERFFDYVQMSNLPS